MLYAKRVKTDEDREILLTFLEDDGGVTSISISKIYPQKDPDTLYLNKNELNGLYGLLSDFSNEYRKAQFLDPEEIIADVAIYLEGLD